MHVGVVAVMFDKKSSQLLSLSSFVMRWSFRLLQGGFAAVPNPMNWLINAFHVKLIFLLHFSYQCAKILTILYQPYLTLLYVL